MIQKSATITEKIWDNDSECMVFDATVIACIPREDGYAVELDRTAFFPEGGGQYADVGTIDGEEVLDVQIDGDHIYHQMKNSLPVGQTVHGVLDATERHCRMQNHTGEHILSGIIDRKFGYHNVGFHLGDREVTMDFDGVFTEEQLNEIEREANEVVYRNVAVYAEYPSQEALAGMEYRSKLELDGNIRIVTIEGVDRCACCAPHVRQTGEIGVIKIVDAIHYKGGTRLWILCGLWAYEDYARRFRDSVTISRKFSVKQEGIVGAVEKLSDNYTAALITIGEWKRKYIAGKIAGVSPDAEGNLLFFESDLDTVTMRNLADQGVEKCQGICGVFCATEQGYRYVLVSRSAALRALGKQMNAALHGRGGGDDAMIQGTLGAGQEEIEAFFSDLWA